MVFSLSWDVFWANRLLRFFVSGGEILSQQNINNKAYLVLRVNSSFNGQRDRYGVCKSSIMGMDSGAGRIRLEAQFSNGRCQAG